MNDFSKYKIKDYNHWSVFIYQNQGYLGRCYVWCNRENALDLTDANLEEREELFVILKELKQALTKAFQPDLLNYLFLGNEIRHLHCHVIPRYENEREFEGKIFKDELWGHSYRSDRSLSFSDDLLEKIRLKIKEELN
jgi:diadenosine tetraphosphate (Ap4A) HIT family hydrolase